MVVMTLAGMPTLGVSIRTSPSLEHLGASSGLCVLPLLLRLAMRGESLLLPLMLLAVLLLVPFLGESLLELLLLLLVFLGDVEGGEVVGDVASGNTGTRTMTGSLLVRPRYL